MKCKLYVLLLSGDRGAALVAVLLLSLVLVPLAIMAHLTANVEMTAEANKYHADQTLCLAEAGLADGADWLCKQAPPPQPASNLPIDLGTTTLGDHGDYAVTVDPADSNDYSTDGPWLYEVASVAASTRSGERTISQLVEIERLRWGDFLYLFDHLGGKFSNDSIFGRTYVRAEPQIEKPGAGPFADTGPVFDKTLFTHEDSLRLWFEGAEWPGEHAGGTDDPAIIDDAAEFRKSYKFNMPELDLKAFSLDEMQARAQECGWDLKNGAVIEFRGDSLEIRNLAFGSEPRVVSLLDEPSPLFIYIGGGQVTIRGGVLNGQVAIAATGVMTIMDDLVYAEDPREVPTSDDMLLLATSNKIQFDSALNTRPLLRTHARVAILDGGSFNTSASDAASECWWDFFGSISSWTYSVTEPRRMHKLTWDWRPPPASFPYLSSLTFYCKNEYGNSWEDHYR